MNNKYQVRHMIISAVFIALGIIIPFFFHSIPNGGMIFLPMHIPAMVAAFFLPWTYALSIGVLTPLLSAFLTGMPPLAPIPMALIMAVEIGVYAVVISLLRKLVFRVENYFAPLIAIIPAMIIGRIVKLLFVIVLAKFFGYGMIKPIAFVWGGALTGLVGIAIQIVFIPAFYRMMVRALPGWNGTDKFFGDNKKKAEDINE